MQQDYDKVYTIEYRIVDQKGSLIDSTDHDEPFSFIQGSGAVLPAIEEHLDGARVGDRRTFTIEPEHAYGERDEDLVRAIPRDRFGWNGDIEVGMRFSYGDDGRKNSAIVVAVERDLITVDANHPLAGESINIDMVVVDVRDALDEELATGTVQEMADIYARERHGQSHESPVIWQS